MVWDGDPAGWVVIEPLLPPVNTGAGRAPDDR
jgi:hypothetical protein